MVPDTECYRVNTVGTYNVIEAALTESQRIVAALESKATPPATNSPIATAVTLRPDLWARLFTQNDTVLGFARQYLVTAGPAFAFFGLGLTLYFASQGSGRMVGPVLAGTVRLVLVAGAGYGLSMHHATASQFYTLVALAMVLYGVVTAGAVKITPWGVQR